MSTLLGIAKKILRQGDCRCIDCTVCPLRYQRTCTMQDVERYIAIHSPRTGTENTSLKESDMTNAQKLEAAQRKLDEAKAEIATVQAAIKAEKSLKIQKGTWCLVWNDKFLKTKGPSIRKFSSFKDGKYYMVGDGGSKTFAWEHCKVLPAHALESVFALTE